MPPVLPPKLRRNAALILLLLVAGLSLLSIVQLFGQVRQQVQVYEAKPGEGATTWMARIERVVRDLPSQGTIGYFSERNFKGIKFNPIDQDEEFAMTQYAVAPRILVDGSCLDYVIVNLPYLAVPDVKRLMAEKNLHMTMEYGNGLYLGRKVRP
jgi:hypothetical protein